MISGTFIINIELNGGLIQGSPWELEVLPGEVLASQSSHTITSLPVLATAGMTELFRLVMRDIYGNLITEGQEYT